MTHLARKAGTSPTRPWERMMTRIGLLVAALVLALTGPTMAQERGWLGVQIQPMTDLIAESLGLQSTQGALVAEARSKSPALRAGIQGGDVITALNGQLIKDPPDLARQIQGMSPGTTVLLTILRDRREQVLSV